MTAAAQAQAGDGRSTVPGALDMWRVLEPYHVVVYFVPEARELYADAGLKGYWMGYFASRSAPMGTVGSEVVLATFHNFAPRMVRRAIPDAWSFSTPERVLFARLRVADAALRRLLGDEVAESAEVAEAASLARRVVEAADPVGRPLFAAHAGLPWPQEPHLALWHGASALREHRFDGHVAALVTHGVGGLESHLLAVGAGRNVREGIQPARGFTDEEWEAGVARLQARGWLDARGALTDAGRRVDEQVQSETDALAQPPYDAAGPEATARLHALMAPLSDRILAAGTIPSVSPLSLR